MHQKAAFKREKNLKKFRITQTFQMEKKEPLFRPQLDSDPLFLRKTDLKNKIDLNLNFLYSPLLN